MSESKQIQRPEELTLGLVPTDIEVKADNALRIPFDQLPALGAGLASLAEAIAPAVAAATAPVLFTVTDAAGSPPCRPPCSKPSRTARASSLRIGTL